MAPALGVRLLGTALVVTLDSTDFQDKGRSGFPIRSLPHDRSGLQKRFQTIPLANSTKQFRAPEGQPKLAGGGARAQPPELVEEDYSRPGRDAGLEFATGLIPVRRPFRARDSVVAFPVVTLRSTTGYFPLRLRRWRSLPAVPSNRTPNAPPIYARDSIISPGSSIRGRSARDAAHAAQGSVQVT